LLNGQKPSVALWPPCETLNGAAKAANLPADIFSIAKNSSKNVIQDPSNRLNARSYRSKEGTTPVKTRIQACESLLFATVHAACRCDIQTRDLFPERSEPENVAFLGRVRFFTEFLSFFISAVDRAAEFRGLTKKQREEIHERIVPGIVEGAIDIVAPSCSADRREKLRGEIRLNINNLESEYSALVSAAVFQKLATNIEQAVEAMHHPAIARKIVLIAREQLRDADFSRLVVAVIEAF
jgi:hypothetical protein